MKKYTVYDYDVTAEYETLEDSVDGNTPIDIDEIYDNFETEADVLTYINNIYDLDKITEHFEENYEYYLKVDFVSPRLINVYIHVSSSAVAYDVLFVSIIEEIV